MRRVLLIALAAFLCPFVAVAQPTTEDTGQKTKAIQHPISEEEWTPESRLWLARSVLGEAGWARWDEYTAIAFVYAERSKASKTHTFIRMIKKYSAAVRRPGKRRNPWLFQTKTGPEALMRPPMWPMGPTWKGLYDKAWKNTLVWADQWYEGKRPNTCPGANHFGGQMDSHRAENKRWKRIKCKTRMRNRFYTSLYLVPRPPPGEYRKRLLRL